MFRTGLRRMSTTSSSTTQASPFTRATVKAMRELYPESLADKSFDNTGLLLEAPYNPYQNQNNSVLLTVDLTKAVADEAIRNKNSIIVAYRMWRTPVDAEIARQGGTIDLTTTLSLDPIIFRGLKSLTLDDSQQQSLLRLAAQGISVYSPHTAVDATPGGMADWLCDIVTGCKIIKNPAAQRPSKEFEELEYSVPHKPSRSAYNYSRPTYPQRQPFTNHAPFANPIPHIRSTIHPNPNPPPGFENAGMGRLVTFSTPQSLPSVIDLIAARLGHPRGISVATPQAKSVEEISIRTVGICPGSGSGVLLGGNETPDLLLTGEMSHHEALGATERGSSVISLFHSNSERGYLRDVMQGNLQGQLEIEWKAVPQGERSSDEIWVDVSDCDRDPYGVVLLQD